MYTLHGCELDSRWSFEVVLVERGQGGEIDDVILHVDVTAGRLSAWTQQHFQLTALEKFRDDVRLLLDNKGSVARLGVDGQELVLALQRGEDSKLKARAHFKPAVGICRGEVNELRTTFEPQAEWTLLEWLERITIYRNLEILEGARYDESVLDAIEGL